MRHAPFVAASFVLRRYGHRRRSLFTAFLESMYRWHQQRAMLNARHYAPPAADATDATRPHGQREDIARPWLPH